MNEAGDPCPRGYMKIGGKRIIIREKKKDAAADATDSLNNKNIVIIESSVSSMEISALNTPPTSPVNASTTGEEETTSSTRSIASSESGSAESVVTFDPLPPSRTILSKTATPKDAKKQTVPAKVTLAEKPMVCTFSSEVKKLDTWQQKKEHKEAFADKIPHIYKVLPDDCLRRYERLTYLPGVKVIPSNTPSWKVPILQKKNQQIVENYLRKKETEHKVREAERSERERQEAIPEWKKPIVRAMEQKRDMEKKKFFEKAQMEKEEIEKFNAMPPWRQELILRKKEQDRLEKLPTWQKDLIVRKKVANTKSTFEKAETVGASATVPWSKLNLRKTNLQH